jgi:AraC-like ligand binding domain
LGAQRSWSGVGQVSSSAGGVIMANPGEMHDGVPVDNNARQWRMIYIDPALLARELKEETARPVEIVHPVAQDLLLARRFAACLLT